MTGARIYGAPRPPRAYISRPRFRDRFETGRPLTVVTGPAGGGKTALLADWCRQREAGEIGGVWVIADESVTTAHVFWRTVLDLMHESGLVDEEQILGQSVAVEQTKNLKSFLQRGFAQVEQPLTIVVDDAHHLDAAARRSICELAASPARLSFVVATRAARGFTETVTATGVDAEYLPDVAFTAAETQAYADLARAGSADEVFTASGGLPLAVRALTTARHGAGESEGSPAGADLGAEPSTTPSESRPDRAGLAISRLLHWIRTAHGDGHFYEALLRCSAADEFTVALAERLSGSSRAARWMNLAEDHGLGMWRETTKTTFAFTTVVRSALREELHRRDPELARQLQRVVAEWSMANGRQFHAFSIAVRIEDLDLASSVVRQVGLAMLHTHGGAIVQLLDPIPLTILSRFPLLAMALGLCHNARRDRRVRGIELLGVAAVAVRRTRATSSSDRALVRALESAALRVTGVGDAGAKAARDSAGILDSMSIGERDSLGALRPALHAHNGLSMFYAGHVEEAIVQFEHSYVAGRPGHRRLHGLALLAGAHALAGELPEARSWMRLAAASNWPDGMLDDYHGCWYRIAQALAALEDFDVDAAQEAVSRMWPIIDTIEHWPLLGHTQAMIDLASGRAAIGLERLTILRRERGKRLASNSQMALLLDATTSVLHLAIGDRAAAEQCVAGRRHGASARSLTARARIALAGGDVDAAFGDLGRAAVLGFPSARVRAEHGAVELAALVRRGRDTEVSTAADRTLAILSARQLRTPLMLLPGADQTAVLAVLDGRSGLPELIPPVPPAVLGSVPMVPTLSRRERVILIALVGTASTAQIAEQLHVSPNTVKSQLRSLYRKLGVNNRSDAIAIASSYGLIGTSGDSASLP